jgi:hypothetical protein
MRITKFTTAPRTRSMGKVVFLLRFYFKADEITRKFEDGLVVWADILMIHSLFHEKGYDLSDRGT